MAGEKRSAAESEELAHQESAILLDVEGTTSSISFVKDTLFPYVREFLKKHVDEKWDTEEFKADFAKLKEQAKEDEEKKVDGFVPIKEDTDEAAKESLVKNVLWQMDNDRKTGALKQLQGHIWKATHKPIKGHVYDDVPKAFEEWTNSGKKLYIYSSGSVEAQKLLFGNTEHGDLLKYISEHFDTEVGPKQEADSYKNILKKINLEPSNVLFLTDVVKEAEAAKAAGLSATIVIREGNAKLSDEDKVAFKTIESFAEISFQSATKRQKLEEKSPIVEKKETPKENESVAAAAEPACEPMDTSEDVEMAEEKKTETTTDPKVEKTVVEAEKPEKLKETEQPKEAEKPKEVEKPKEETKKVEKEETPMEEETKPEKTTTATKTENEKSEATVPAKKAETSTEKVIEMKEEKKPAVSEEKSKSKVSTEVKKSEETENKSEEPVKPIEKIQEEKKAETEKKSEESTSEKVVEKVAEEVTKKVTEEVTEKIVEKVSEKVAETVTEKVATEVKETVAEAVTEAKKIEEETKPEVKETLAAQKKPTEEVKENGEANIEESEKTSKSTEEKVDEGENKENVQSAEEAAKVEKKVESDVEVAEEAKETKETDTTDKENEKEKEKEKEKEVETAKPEVEKQKEVEVQKLNGTTTNGDSTEDVADKKVHSNGVSEEAEKTTENGDTEESIKVKKAVADGAGEPDVVSPPVVAATS